EWTKARTLSPRASDSRTVALPTLPVAPVMSTVLAPAEEDMRISTGCDCGAARRRGSCSRSEKMPRVRASCYPAKFVSRTQLPKSGETSWALNQLARRASRTIRRRPRLADFSPRQRTPESPGGGEAGRRRREGVVPVTARKALPKAEAEL